MLVEAMRRVCAQAQEEGCDGRTGLVVIAVSMRVYVRACGLESDVAPLLGDLEQVDCCARRDRQRNSGQVDENIDVS
jgi:hypothetical protein